MLEWAAAAEFFALGFLLAGLIRMDRRIRELKETIQLYFAVERIAKPATPEHIATLAQGIQEGNASLLGAIAATTEIRDGQAGRLAMLREALRAYELSHAHTQTHTVNGFTKTETILCDCALCSAARDALG